MDKVSIPSAQFMVGLKNIENAIKWALRDVHPDAVPEFHWNRTAGGHLVPPQATASVEVFLRGRRFSAAVSREQVTASSERVQRADVVHLVNQAVEALRF